MVLSELGKEIEVPNVMERIVPRPYTYKIVDFLGEGLNSHVFRALKEDEASGVSHEVALKILKSRKLVDLWRNEFARLSGLRSTNCVALLGWEWLYDRPALVLEFVNGVNLASLLDGGQTDQGDIESILQQVRNGLDDLKASGIVHGDLNLNNIMIDASGIVKIVDFGLHGAAGDFFLTPEFADPGVLQGAAPSHESDEYSYMKLKEYLNGSSLVLQKSEGSLGEKVKRIMEKRRLKRQKTAVLTGEKPAKKKWAAYFKASALSLFLLFGDMGPLKGETIVKALVHVRTIEWLKVTMNQETRFSPATFEIDGNKEVALQFESARGQGKTVLTVPAGKSIVLNDEFFRSHDSGDLTGTN